MDGVVSGQIVQFPRKFGQTGEQWNPWLTKAQAAQLLGRTERWINLMHAEGIPSRVGKGGRREYPHDELVRWWAERSRTSA